MIGQWVEGTVSTAQQPSRAPVNFDLWAGHVQLCRGNSQMTSTRRVPRKNINFRESVEQLGLLTTKARTEIGRYVTHFKEH